MTPVITTSHSLKKSVLLYVAGERTPSAVDGVTVYGILRCHFGDLWGEILQKDNMVRHKEERQRENGLGENMQRAKNNTIKGVKEQILAYVEWGGGVGGENIVWRLTYGPSRLI